MSIKTFPRKKIILQFSNFLNLFQQGAKKSQQSGEKLSAELSKLQSTSPKEDINKYFFYRRIYILLSIGRLCELFLAFVESFLAKRWKLQSTWPSEHLMWKIFSIENFLILQPISDFQQRTLSNLSECF